MTAPTPPPPFNPAGLTPAQLHEAALKAMADFTVWCATALSPPVAQLLGAGNAARMAVLLTHAPDVSRAEDGIGIGLCIVESTGESKIGWPCGPWNAAVSGLILGAVPGLLGKLTGTPQP